MITKPSVRIGLIGAGFMGRCHANAFRSVSGLFDLPVEPVAEMLADMNEEVAVKNAQALGYRRSTGDWRALCNDPDIDIVAITAPNVFHEPIALEAIAAGKAVYCEKPLSTTLKSALCMTEAAEKAGVLTLVGFNFLRNPLIQLAKEIIDAGELGQIINFRGRHAENYMVDGNTPHSFRTDKDGGGALADLGSHIISMARHLVGEIDNVSARTQTVHKDRPVRAGSNDRAPVVVDDISQSIVGFKNGAIGSIEANWAATGRKMDLSWEVTGTKGALAFSQERMNELWLYTDDTATNRSGFRKIETGPEHPPYGQFCPAPGHHLGFNDLKVMEVAELLNAFATGNRCNPDFREAYEVQRVVSAMQASDRSGASVSI